MVSIINRSLVLAGALSLLLPLNGPGGKPQTTQTSVQRAATTKQEAAERTAARKRLARLKKMPPVRGVVFHCCSCAVPCPCMFNGEDVAGCNIVRIYHITDGGYVGKHLTGLTVVYIPHPEDLRNKEDSLRQNGQPVDGVLYLPSGLTPSHESDLIGTLAEQNLTVAWNKNLRRRVSIVFRKQADGYDVEIGKIFRAKIRTVKGDNGKPIIADNLPLDEGTRWYIGRSLVHDYQDAEEKDWRWNLPKSNGSWTFFAWGPHIDPSDENMAKKR